MASFTASIPLNMRLPGGFEISGAAGVTHSIPDSLTTEFIRDVVPVIKGTVTWISQDENSAKYDKTGGTITGNARVTGRFAVGADGGPGIPINLDSNLIAADISGDYAIGVQMSPRIYGDYSTVGGLLDPGYAWPVSIFSATGTAATDGRGLIDITNFVSEIAIQSSSASHQYIRTGHFITSLWGASSGGIIDQIEGIRIGTPRYAAGALAANWTVTSSVGLVIEDFSATAVPGTTNYSMYITGGTSRFQGPVEVAASFAQTGLMRVGGTSFPASPATFDTFFRHDYGENYYYDGTRWLSTNIYTMHFNAFAATAVTTVERAVMPFNTTGARRDLWLVGWTAVSIVQTPHDGSNFWTIALTRQASGTTIASFTTVGDTVNVQTQHGGAISALVGTSDLRLFAQATLTGAPAAIYCPIVVEYRRVAT